MLFATLDSTVSACSTPVCSQTCGQKPLSEHPRDRGQKAVFIVCRSAADGCFVAPVCRIVPLLERLSKSFMQGQAAQNLHRYRQRRINFRSKHEWPVQQNLPCPHRQPCQCFYGSGHRLHTSHLSPPGSPACRCKNGR